MAIATIISKFPNVSSGSGPLSVSCNQGTVIKGTAVSGMYLVGTGGTAPYTNYAIFSGSLPTGLSLNATTGNITGTPTVSGSFPFVANVTDSAPSTAAG